MKPKFKNHSCFAPCKSGVAALIVTLAFAHSASAQTNTKTGQFAGNQVTSGKHNSSYGYAALQRTKNGSYNSAFGSQSLQFNVDGINNTATGYGSMKFNASGSFNTATGSFSLFRNTSGKFNTATGRESLFDSTTGSNNVAQGYQSLRKNKTGGFNVAVGDGALWTNTTGSSNIGIGEDGGYNLTTGSNNICIGNKGVAGQSGIIRIGTDGTHSQTYLAGTSRMSNGAVVTNGLNVVSGGAVVTNGLNVVSGGASVSGNTTLNSSLVRVGGSASRLAVNFAGFANNTMDMRSRAGDSGILNLQNSSANSIFSVLNNTTGSGGLTFRSTGGGLIDDTSFRTNAGSTGSFEIGTAGGERLSLDSNEVQAVANGNTATGLFLNFFGGNVDIGSSGATTTIRGTFVNASDRNLKEDVGSVDRQAVLDRLVELPVSTWKYKESKERRHVGPMAQDFHAAFNDLLNLNSDDKTIAPLDEAGIAFTAIQALHEMVENKDAEISTLKDQQTALEDRLAKLERLIEKSASSQGEY